MIDHEPTDLELAVARAILARRSRRVVALPDARMLELLADPSSNELAAESVRESFLDARAAIAECFRWQLIETAPKGRPILGYGEIDDSHRGWFQCQWDDGDEEWIVTVIQGLPQDSMFYCVYLDATHWMPLLSPPDTDHG